MLFAGAQAAGPSWSEEVRAGKVPLDAAIVVLGEEHDAPVHHRNQGEWIARLRPAAVVFEMIPPDLGAVATGLLGAAPRDVEEALRWESRGWPDFEIYAPIFEAIPDGAMIFGAEVGREDLSRAMVAGASEAYADLVAGADPFGLNDPLPDAERRTRRADQIEAHCDLLPENAAAGMVEAQRLRDAALAVTALDALDATGGPVAVITGNGHARTDWGVPALISRARANVEVVSVGQFTRAVDKAPYDYWVVTEPPEGRDPDPCAALR